MWLYFVFRRVSLIEGCNIKGTKALSLSPTDQSKTALPGLSRLRYLRIAVELLSQKILEATFRSMERY
ncbi:MAG: hypothetical protein F6K37_30625 [Moorea sp. SIO4E2]|nr:hypothetical protein [Moorena sp. SIO4E2]